MKIYVSGGSHLVTNVDKRIQEIEEELDNPDAIFVEQRVNNSSKKEKLLNWVASPLLLTSLTAWFIFLWIGSHFSTSDDVIQKRLKKKYEIDVYYVDKPIHQMLSEQRFIWGVANWAILVLPIILVVFSPSLGTIAASTLFTLTGCASIMMAFLAASMSQRNVHMVLTISEIKERDDFEGDEGCLITGGSHSSELRRLIRNNRLLELA